MRRMHSAGGLSILAAALATTACADSGAAPDASAKTVRDSAGIEIVELTGPPGR